MAATSALQQSANTGSMGASYLQGSTAAPGTAPLGMSAFGGNSMLGVSQQTNRYDPGNQLSGSVHNSTAFNLPGAHVNPFNTYGAAPTSASLGGVPGPQVVQHQAQQVFVPTPAQPPVAQSQPMPNPANQWMQAGPRPIVTHPAGPPIIAGNGAQYGPSFQMACGPRSTADKTAVKYTGFLPLEGVYEEDTCRIG